MIAIDANLLVYAHRRDSEWHEPAARCVRDCAQGRAPWGLPWPCLHEFYAIVTHPRIFTPPTACASAVDQIDAWLESPSVVLIAEGVTHWPELRRLLSAGRIVGPQVHDARVATLCLTHGVRELWTADRDFSRFPSLATRNPLTAR